MLTYDKFQLRGENEENIETNVESDDEDSEDDENQTGDTIDEEVVENPDDADDHDDSCVEWVDVEDDFEYVDEENNYTVMERDDADLNEINGVEVMRCAAHTLALSVNDTTTKLKLKQRFKKFRKFAKFLRTPNQVEKLKRNNLSLPKMDVVVRWNSSYDLIHSMMKLKSYCATTEIRRQSTKAKVKQLTAADWKFAKTFLRVFKPPKICTKLLQGKQVTLSDFFQMWTDLTLRVKKISSQERMAAELLKNLTKREEMLFSNNKALQAALYLDPRFRLIFVKMKPNYFDEATAQQHLFQLYKHLKSIEVS